MKVVKLLDQASEDGPRDSLREQVGDHHDAGEVFDGDDTTADEIAKELGGTQAISPAARHGRDRVWGLVRRLCGHSPLGLPASGYP